MACRFLGLAFSQVQPDPLLVGASRAEQVKENVTSLDVGLGPEHLQQLNAASALPMLNPYFTFDLPRERIVCGQAIMPWR